MYENKFFKYEGEWTNGKKHGEWISRSKNRLLCHKGNFDHILFPKYIVLYKNVNMKRKYAKNGLHPIRQIPDHATFRGTRIRLTGVAPWAPPLSPSLGQLGVKLHPSTSDNQPKTHYILSIIEEQSHLM